jgi:hypothetical protein
MKALPSVLKDDDKILTPSASSEQQQTTGTGLPNPVCSLERSIHAPNATGLNRIMEHYAPDVEFEADAVVRRWQKPDGKPARSGLSPGSIFELLWSSPQVCSLRWKKFSRAPTGYAALYRRKNSHRVLDVVELDCLLLNRDCSDRNPRRSAPRGAFTGLLIPKIKNRTPRLRREPPCVHTSLNIPNKPLCRSTFIEGPELSSLTRISSASGRLFWRKRDVRVGKIPAKFKNCYDAMASHTK